MKTVFTAIVLLLGMQAFAQQRQLTYSVPSDSWDEKYGNHRAVLEIAQPAEAVTINFLWRRNDAHPEARQMQVIHAETGEAVKNIYRVHISKERCELVFGPVLKSGTYYFYYLPYQPETKQYVAGPYLHPEPAPDTEWVRTQVWGEDSTVLQPLPVVKVTELQARSPFHSFYPMEVVATSQETDSLLQQYDTKDFLVFPEDRLHPIRMRNALPLRWIEREPGAVFHGVAQKNEYYAFQLGIVAAQKNITDIRPDFSGLQDDRGNTIAASAFTCFNTDGVDTKGKPFTKKVNVRKGAVQPLWIGIDIPADAKPGRYTGTVSLQSVNSSPQHIPIEIVVGDSVLADRGDGETWRHSRLRWLNSTLGINDQPTLAYRPLSLVDNTISATNKTIKLGASGLPVDIRTSGDNMLSSPIQFVVEMGNRILRFTPDKLVFTDQKPGVISWRTELDNDTVRLVCHGEIEFDGRLKYTYEVEARQNIHIQDIRLELPLKKEYSTYMMGMGRMGGFTPRNHISRWSRTEDAFWIGATTGGLQCELRGGQYHGPLLNLYQPYPPASWFNGVNGGFRIDGDDESTLASAYSGARNMSKGQTVRYEFALLITPVKEMDWKAQFTNRYVHSPYPSEKAIENGGNVMNIHHANKYNPFINYPFIAQKEMKEIVEKWHKRDWKVKIYYTVRELSNYLTEIWALRSLGDEVLAGGGGGGNQWLQEHLVTGYTPTWYTHIGNGQADAAILNGSESRWYNYYIEGLHWLMKNMDIDGLYLDDVSFDRNILKRIRKVMELTKPDCQIDLHSNTAFSLGSANQNLEMYPYIDKTWFGEGFNFDLMPPDFWLTEVSGIPFGIGNDILMHMSVNNKRGMTYGMTHRGFFPMWKLWDEFGIVDSRMIGYWDKHPVVTTNRKGVYATAYVKEGRTLIALGNWTSEPVTVVPDIDWKALGLNSRKVTISAPSIEGYQAPAQYRVGQPVVIGPKDDCLLIVSEK